MWRSSRRGISATRHRRDELAEHVARVARPGARLGVVLHRPGAQLRRGDALDRAVEEARAGDLDAVGQAVGDDRVAVVLHRDLDAAVVAAAHRVVGAAVAEGELLACAGRAPGRASGGPGRCRRPGPGRAGRGRSRSPASPRRGRPGRSRRRPRRGRAPAPRRRVIPAGTTSSRQPAPTRPWAMLSFIPQSIATTRGPSSPSTPRRARPPSRRGRARRAPGARAPGPAAPRRRARC